MERNRGTALVLTGVLLLAVTLVASAALVPSRTVDGDGSNETIVSVQGFRSPGSVQGLNGSDVAWELRGAGSYFEAERLADGTVAVAFFEEGTRECGEFDPPCARTGYRIVEPGDGAGGGPAVVGEWSFPVRSGTNSEVHAVDPLPDGGFAVVDMEYERLLVVEDGEVAWQWNASELYDAPPDPTTVDWLHMNDVDHLGGDRFLVSVRNANQLVVVERGEGAVEVINEDTGGDDGTCTQGSQLDDYSGDSGGDVRCGDPAVLNHQHNPHWLGDGAVLVADSDNDRAVELRRTDDGWKPVWTLESAGDLQFNWPRDADRLPDGNTLVTDTRNERVLEVDPNGTVVWSVSTEAVPYEADRVPVGERTGVPSHGTDVDSDTGRADPGSGDVPLLSPAVVGLQAVVPWLPYWVGELQVFVAAVSLVLVAGGIVTRYRE
jgi:hypothetical protein